MKKTILILVLSFLTFLNATSMTYDQLINDKYTDHIYAFDKLFRCMEVDHFLEFGMGLGTQYFLDHCKKVMSVELVVKNKEARILPWYKKSVKMYQNKKHWTHKLIHLSNKMNQANEIAWKRLDPSIEIGNDYIEELNNVCDSLFKDNIFDVAFVDPGIYLRGDLVCALFGRVDIIVAHDMNGDYRVYNWHKTEHKEYEKFFVKRGRGTSIWVHKSREDVLKKLRPFFS